MVSPGQRLHAASKVAWPYLKVLDTRYMIEDVVAELVPAINPEGKMRAGSCHRIPQSSSASRRTAGAAGFLNLSQSGERPDR